MSIPYTIAHVHIVNTNWHRRETSVQAHEEGEIKEQTVEEIAHIAKRMEVMCTTLLQVRIIRVW